MSILPCVYGYNATWYLMTQLWGMLCGSGPGLIASQIYIFRYVLKISLNFEFLPYKRKLRIYVLYRTRCM